MLDQRRIRRVQLAIAAVIACVAPVSADAMPRPHEQDGITYITGGIGEERRELEAVARDYNFRITDSEKSGSFMAGIDLIIRARNGRDVLRLRDTGPLFYARLPPGDYIVLARFRTVEREQKVQVPIRGSANIQFVWPGQD
jgi:hypothetical protein